MSSIPMIPSKFQSTLSVRRATVGVGDGRLLDFISIHALREESDMAETRHNTKGGISIHALREESDWSLTLLRVCWIFQSTLSVRRATDDFAASPHVEGISIHALREESDACGRMICVAD